jgi:hypothetical protein
MLGMRWHYKSPDRQRDTFTVWQWHAGKVFMVAIEQLDASTFRVDVIDGRDLSNDVTFTATNETWRSLYRYAAVLCRKQGEW